MQKSLALFLFLNSLTIQVICYLINVCNGLGLGIDYHYVLIKSQVLPLRVSKINLFKKYTANYYFLGGNRRLGKDIQMLCYSFTFKDEDPAGNGIPSDTLQMRTLDFEEAE